MAVFDYILSLSLRGSILIAVVALIRQLIRHYPKKYSYALWCIVFFSLVVQITVPTDFANPLNTLQQMAVESYEAVTHSYAEEVEIHHSNTEEYSIAVGKGVVPIQTQTENYVITTKDSYEAPKTIGEILLPKLHFVWMAGVVLLFVMYLKNVVDIISLLKFSVCCKNDIYYNEYIKTPFTFGFFRAKIYLPSDIDSNEAQYIIAHEKVHISRFDHIAKPLFLFITILHWFNPLVWLAFSLMTKDMELSCDEKVIKALGNENKKEYCTALLHFALKDKPYKMSAVLFGESNCSQRIKNVLNFKQPKKIMAAVLGIIIAVVAVSTVATKAENNGESNTDRENQIIYGEETEFIPDYDVEKYDSLPEYTEDGIPIDEIKQYPGHIAVVPQGKNIYYYGAVDSDYFKESVFIGDSFADGFRVYETIDNAIADKAEFITWNNMTPQQFVSEIDDLEHRTGLDKAASFDPYSIYIMMGTDALVFMSNGKFISEYEGMLDAVKAKMPDAKVYVCSVPPVSAEQAEKRTAFEKENLAVINSYIAQIAADNGAYYLNLHEILADESGYLSKDYDLFDGIHIYSRRYSYIINYLRTHVAVEEEDLDDKSFTRWLLGDMETYNQQFAYTTTAGGFRWPTAGGVRITRGFTNGNSYEMSPRVVDGKIRALNPGIITRAGDGSVVVSNATYEDIYVHCAEILVKEGDYVKEDQEIAVLDGSVSAKDYRMSQYPAPHSGVDIAGPLDTEIYAAADGVVVEAEYTTTGNGVYIVLEHSNGMKTLYAHCSELKAKAGDKVTKGQLIALMGSTGNSTGPHLHFEIIDKNGVSVDPYKYL